MLASGSRLILLSCAVAFLKLVDCRCPQGAVEGLQPSTCYKLSQWTEAKSFFEAEETCVGLGGHLASIKNAFENAFIKGLLSTYPPDNRIWIGGTTQLTGTWSWTDNTPFKYTNWAKDQPTTGGPCVQIENIDGSWESTACSSVLLYICEVNSVPSEPSKPETTAHPQTRAPAPPSRPCPNDWLFYQPTSSCFKGTSAGGFYDVLSACQAMGATLASIHAQQLNRFIAAYFAYQQSWIWLGLYDPLRSHSWEWTDGSAVNYTNWNKDEPSGDGFCVDMFNNPNTSQLLGKWNDDDCYANKLPGICERRAVWN